MRLNLIAGEEREGMDLIKHGGGRGGYYFLTHSVPIKMQPLLNTNVFLFDSHIVALHWFEVN